MGDFHVEDGFDMLMNVGSTEIGGHPRGASRLRHSKRLLFFVFSCLFWPAGTALHGQTIEDGIAALEAGRMDEAVRILSEIVQNRPDSFEGQFYLGLTHF